MVHSSWVMDKIVIAAASMVGEEDVRMARLGTRFGRLDLASQLALVAVEALGVNFDLLPRELIGICLAARAGSLATDFDFWRGRDNAGGPSPTLFAYTLPSSAIGEIAIRHRLTGPNLCLTGEGSIIPEACDLLRRGEAQACLCVFYNVVTPAIAGLINSPAAALAGAILLRLGGNGVRELGENDRDIEKMCRVLCPKDLAS